MATYYGTYGQKVQYLASDPSDPQIGQVWYNSTSAVLKVRSATTAGTWAAGGNLNTARGSTRGSGSSNSSAVVFGGQSVGGGTTGVTELYNGTSWTNNPTGLGTARYSAGAAGTSQIAALIFGGDPSTAVTESWNGTSWTSTSPINTTRRNARGNGLQTAALIFGGQVDGASPNKSAATESWNGSSWTTVNSLTLLEEIQVEQVYKQRH
jgi:hypothetical protein